MSSERAECGVLLLRSVLLLWSELFLRFVVPLPRKVSYAEHMGSRSQNSTNRIVADALTIHRSRLRRYVAARTSSQNVEEVLQAAAVRAIERAGSLEDPDSALPWLYRIHKSTLIDTGRKRATVERHRDPQAEVQEVSAQQEEEHCSCGVYQAQHLRPDYSKILNLVDMKGSSLSEAAEGLGISANNAYVRLHRARAALRRKMLEHCGVTRVSECNACRCAEDGCCDA